MEFNADAIATFVVGSRVKTDALLRLDLSDAAFSNAIRFYATNSVDYDTKNIYDNQTALLEYLGKENDHVFKNELPYINENEFERYNKSKLKIEDQWASHPTIPQRIEAIKKLNITSENTENRLAKNILQKFEDYAEVFTNNLFTYNDLKHSLKYVDKSLFIEEYEKLVSENSFSKIFNSYYDYKNPVLENFKELASMTYHPGAKDFFSDENIGFVFEKNALDKDYQIIELIGNGTYKLKSFDYDGQKYAKNQTTKPKKIISERQKYINQVLKENDEKIFLFLYYHSNEEQKRKLLEMQQNFNDADAMFDQFFKDFNEFIPYLNFMSETHHSEEIIIYRKKLLDKEKDFKGSVQKLMASVYGKYLLDEQKIY